MNAVEAAVRSVSKRAGVEASSALATVGQVARIRERHHGIARLIVAGLSDADVCRTFGLSLRRLEMLKEQTPAFVELIAYYRSRGGAIASAVETYIDVLERNMIAAEAEIADRLAETPEDFTVSELHKVARDAADRLGFGKRSTQLNVNADFASVLEAARRRSDEARGPTVVDAVANPEREVHSPRPPSSPVPSAPVTPRAAELHSRQAAAKALMGDPPPTKAVLRRI